MHFLQIIFQRSNDFIADSRHQLNDEASGFFYALVSVHQHTQSDRRRNLLADRKIIGQILADFSGNQLYLTGIGLLQSLIPDHGKGSPAYSPSDIQFAVRSRIDPHL